MPSELSEAKQALEQLIKKSRVHLYKPIQIAEILYHHRTQDQTNIELLTLETYRNPSKKWRDLICMQFLGRVSTSSAKYQDNLFEENAIPPRLLHALGKENIQKKGVIEAGIYHAFEEKHLQLEQALNYCLDNNKNNFYLQIFLNSFWTQAGLKRSLDKILEIVVYALFETLTTAIEVKIDIYYDPKKTPLLQEFSDFSKKVLNLDNYQAKKTLDAHFHRVGVTNAADRGLDMYANFGSTVQIKHLSLTEEIAENVVTSITSDRIIIICKDAEKKVLQSLLNQMGWHTKIQAIITIDELTHWYQKALHGQYSHQLGDQVLRTLANEIKSEFPSVGNSDFQLFKKERGYDQFTSQQWS